MKNVTLFLVTLFLPLFFFGQTPCTPISTLDCEDVVVSLPVNLDFSAEVLNTIQESTNFGTGFTAVLEHAETRFTSNNAVNDLPISNASINGYEPSLLTLSGGNLAIQSQAGIAYLNNNNQINTLGVGFDNLTETISIKSKLLNVVTGGSSAQAGIWFGFDEDNFVKLDVNNNNNVELRVERAGVSLNNATDQVQVNAGASGNDVILEMIINPSSLTVEAFYTIGSGARTFLASLTIPANYITGRDLNGSIGQTNVSFAGIYATHRNGSQFTATFDDFSVEEVPNTAPSITSLNTASVLENQTVAIDVDATDDSAGLVYTLDETGGVDFGQFDIDAETGEVTFVIAPDYEVPSDDGGDNIYNITVKVTDAGLLSVTQEIAITVVDIVDETPPTTDFSFIEDFDDYTPATGNLDELSNGDWVKQPGDAGKPAIPVVSEGLTLGTTSSLEIDSQPTNAVYNFQKLMDAPVALQPNVPFYFGTYFEASELGANNSNRIRVAVRVDDAGGEAGAGWIRHIIGNYGGTYYARLGLGGSNTNNGQTAIFPGQLLQFLVKGIWDDTSNTISYEYTISPTLTEGANTWIAANAEQSVTGIPKLGRIFISSTSPDNKANIGPIRLSTTYSEVVTELVDSDPLAAFESTISDLNVAVDASASLDDNSIASYSWEFGDGTSATGVTASHDYAASGVYTISLTVEDNQGNTTVSTESVTVDAPFIATFPYQINFQDQGTTPPAGYVKDYGLPYGENEGGLTYGWVKLSDGQPVDLTTPSNGTGRNRQVNGVDLLLNTLVHIQGNDIASWTGGRSNEGVWEIALDNGWYEVTVGVGDPNTDGSPSDSPIHYIDVEGVNAIPLFTVNVNLPAGDPGRFQTNTVIVEVTDGKLTIDADNEGAFRTKINYATIAQASDPRSTDTDIVAFAFTEQTGAATIDSESGTITIEVANGSGLAALTPSTFTVSPGATVSPLGTLEQDYTNPVEYTVTAENTTDNQTWTVTVTEEAAPLSAETDIVAFAFDEATGPATISSENHTITIEVPDGTVVTALTPSTFTLSEGATASPDENSAQDFSSPVNYTVTAEDTSTSQQWTVTVTVAAPLNTAPSITSLATASVLENQTAAIDVDAGDDLDEEGSGLTYTFDGGADDALFTIDAATGAVAFIAEPDFEAAGDVGEDNVYNITVKVTDSGLLSDTQDIAITVTDIGEATEIIAFTLAAQTVDAVINSTDNTVTIEVENGTDLVTLIPTITISGDATINPESGVVQDFTSPVTYTVTAEDTTITEDWIITVTEAPSTAADIIAFSFDEQTGAATINTTDNTVTIEVANGTSLLSLSPTIEVSADATISPNSEVAQDFTSPVTYSVTAQDGVTSVDWSITVNEAPSIATDITLFTLVEQTGSAVINTTDNTVTIEVANGTSLLSLSPTIEVSADATISPDSEVAQDFTSPVTYTVSAQDGITTENWIVTVNEAPSIETDIVAFTFDEATGPATISSENHTITIEVPDGTVVTALTPSTFTLSEGATASPDGNSAQDFSSPVNYTVTAEDTSTSQQWTVTVTVAVPLNTAPSITSLATASVLENQTAAIDVETGDDFDTEGSGLTYTFDGGADDALFTIDAATGAVAFIAEPDFEAAGDVGEDNVYNITVKVTDSGLLSTTQDIAITVTDVDETVPFAAKFNFQNAPTSTTPPTGYVADYGKDFGNLENVLTLNETDYTYGWKSLTTDQPLDVSTANGGAGRNRIASTYNGESDQNKLLGTLIHFQGDNIVGWSGQARGNELYWELVVPNGTYEVTLGLGDVSNSIDSRHSATVEGYTIIAPFNPVDTKTNIATMIVEVTDGLLTVNGLGGFNSKITHIEIVESTGSAVNGILAFDPTGLSENLGVAGSGLLVSNLSGAGAGVISLLINDNLTASNDWLTLPATNALGNYEFVTNATDLLVGNTREDQVIASTQGYKPAILDLDLTVIEINTPPIIEDQSFIVSEDAAIATEIATVEAIDAEDSITYAITAGNEAGDLAINPNTGIITNVVTLNNATTPQYLLTVEVSDTNLTDSATITIDVAVGSLPCSPISTLDCDQIDVALPLALDFTAINGNISETGFTMVLEPSSRLAADDEFADANVPGYAPLFLNQGVDGLTITSTKGIFYSQLSSQGSPNSTDTNSQMNALGVGLNVPLTTFSVSTTLLNPDFSESAGNNSQQTGLWFGLDEDHIIKLVIAKTGAETEKIQLQVENMDETTAALAYRELNTANVALADEELVALRLEFDPINNTVKGFYSINGGAEVQVSTNSIDLLSVPASYFAGTSYDTNNPSELSNFAGVFATHRRAAGDQSIDVLFKSFEIEAEEVIPTLAFDVTELNFTVPEGGTVAAQTTTLSANTGNPSVTFQEDPESPWLIMPLTAATGLVEFGINPTGLVPGTYSTNVFAIDQPDLGFVNGELVINLTVTPAENDFAVNINFATSGADTEPDYEVDSGLGYGSRGNGLTYGWLETTGTTPIDLSDNARNRNSTVSLLTKTLIHMQYGDTGGGNGVATEGIWEIDVPNGVYRVTVGVGDPGLDGEGTGPIHRINAEGVNVVDDFVPTGGANALTRFTTGTAVVNVTDGKLTIDASDGFNTKINYANIVPATSEPQTPRVVGVFPADGATNVSTSTNVSANELFFPNFDENGVAGLNNATVNTSTVKLEKQGSLLNLSYTVNSTGGGDAINLSPTTTLESNTTYVFTVDGVEDTSGEAFEVFTSTFTTGDGNTGGGDTDLDNVAFDNAGPVASNGNFSSLTVGPDGKFYGLEIGGDIYRWDMDVDGSLINQEILDGWKEGYGSRAAIGLAFAPDATSSALVAYISHQSGALSNAPDWDGNISRISGPDLATEELLVTRLPRSLRDHLTNSIAFKPGEPNVLYFNQGSNSAAGKPDNAWGNRPESLLSAANLRLDLTLLPNSDNLPINVETTRDIDAIKAVDVNSPTLDGLYNPYYVNAPLTLYATGIRNAYDLLWHSNGQLYIPTNGTAGGSNAPASIDDMYRPDGTFYNHQDVSGNYPVISASDGNNTQRDWLFRIDPSSTIGYYGHPNPFRGEFVLNRGDEDVNNAVYNGVVADVNYRGAAFDFEFNKSPNGVIEYKSSAENGNLKGAILVVRYSGGSDIIALVPDGANGDIGTFKEGIPGFTGFDDPLDLVEDVNTGNIYVSDYGTRQIILLTPKNEASPTPVIAVGTNLVVGDAIASGENLYEEEISLSNLGNATLENIQASITGAASADFEVVDLPATLNAQNTGSFNVRFNPSNVGPAVAELTISGDNTDPVIIQLQGLGKLGSGGTNEPSLQWILDTHLGAGVINVGDTNVATNLIDLPNGSAYNDILGDEIDAQKFERAADGPVSLELLSVYGPEGSNPIVAFGWYESGSANATTEVFTVENDVTNNGQTLNPVITGILQFDPGAETFGFFNRWPAFNNRQLYSEDALNTFSGAIPHHIRVYELPGEENAYIIATEEHIQGFDYQDVVVIARNVKLFDDTPQVACSPISTLECDQIEVALPFALAFNGAEGGLAETGFTMVDNPSARLAADNPVFNSNVPGFEPGQLSFNNGNLIIEATQGIAYRTNGGTATTSTNTNSQINALGVGINADSYGNFSITTTIVSPYSDASNDSEQAGIWFGLDEDNFVKLVANSSGSVELRSEVNALSVGANQETTAVDGLNTSTVTLRLYVDVDNDELVAFYTLNNGAEVEFGSLPLAAEYINGNADYDNLSFAGIFATKRREDAGTVVNYSFEDFGIEADENDIAFEPVNINFSTANDTPPEGYLVDSGLGFGDRGNTYNYGWLSANDNTTLDLSSFARNRGIGSVSLLQNTLIHMQYGDIDDTTPAGIWEIDVPNGSYNVTVGVGDPTGLDSEHSINVEGVNAIDKYVPSGAQGASARFTSATVLVEVTDGKLTIDANGGVNTKINSIGITQSTVITEPYFANVSPRDDATGVFTNNFQITVEVITPAGYELDKNTLAGNVNLYEVTSGGEVLVPSNSNDTGGGDAITLTPSSNLKPFTEYVFRLTSSIEANLVGDINTRIPFTAFESSLTTGEEDIDIDLDLTGVEFTQVNGEIELGAQTTGEYFSSLVIGPDGKLYASTIGNFQSDGKIFRWDIAADGTLENLQILSPELTGAAHPEDGARNNNNRLIIGLTFDPTSTAEDLIAYITHSAASVTDGPEWDGVLTRLTGPNLETVQDLIVHLPRSGKDHLTNSIAFDPAGDLFITQGSNSAGGDPDPNWVNRPERLLSAAILKVELDKLPSSLPLSAFTTDDISAINNAADASLTYIDGQGRTVYNPWATNAPLTLFATGVRNAYDLLWHSNGWLYVPTNGTAGNNNTSPNSPATESYTLARRIDGLNSIPSVPALRGGETQKDWLFKTKGGSYHGHPNPYRGEFVLNHGGAPYSGVPGQINASDVDVNKYPDDLLPDPNYRQPAYDFEFNKSPNGVIEYQSNAFGGKLEGLLLVVRFSGQDDLLVMQPKANGDIANVNGDVPGLGGFDDPLDLIEDPRTGNIYVSEYDRNGDGTSRITLLRAAVPAVIGPEIAATPEELIFEIRTDNSDDDSDTKVVSITNNGTGVLNIQSASITGVFANQFDAVTPSGSQTVNVGESIDYSITYAPETDNSNLGYQDAALAIVSDDAVNPTFNVGLHALKKRGYEGGNEPFLQQVVNTLGIGIDVGWNSLSNGTDPDPIGDEVEVETWIKATEGPITITAVGRYSPAETLPFGWYTNNNGTVNLNEVDAISNGLPNAQTLNPVTDNGVMQFDPQGAVFGIYTDSNTFNRTNYTEDALNALQSEGVTHRTRIYPMADRDGNAIENSYLIAFEDATNGDYQDYVFVIDNVTPFVDGSLVLNFDKPNLDFVASISEENVDAQEITLSANGGVTASEIILSTSEDWIVLPETYEVNTAFELGVDITGLSIGNYETTVTATAPNYQGATITVNLSVTNELVYTYQFNFQDPDNVEVSPPGYIDDIGLPFAVRNTNLGDIAYGWVEPGTLAPANAGENARNRKGDALLSTFTIMGHRTAATYPLRDWVVNVPNGSYSVNISVGDPDFTDSNHVLDVNGVTVLDYDQENAVSNGSDNYEETQLVEVVDGTLRLSLGAGGTNAKPNYIRLAPYDISLFPPTITATFDGNENVPGVYRGLVSITLEAKDLSESGGIESLQYSLDGNPVEDYLEAIVVTENGVHVLVVTAKDANGNTTEETYNFTVEPSSGALLAIENMTKIPGTNRSFPAEDYFTFHRVGDEPNRAVHDTNTLRIHNEGTADLIITEVNISDTNDFTASMLTTDGPVAISLPMTITAGQSEDLEITFIGTTPNNGIGNIVENISIVSNADNSNDAIATLNGAYSRVSQGSNEITAQQVFDAFGFQTSMLSIVNDDGTIDPPNQTTFRPSSNYPDADNIDAGYEGDMILSSTFVQADSSQPVRGIQISALHGPGSNGAKFIEANGTGTIGGINFSHGSDWFQTLLPRESNSSNAISFDSASSINEPFRIQIATENTSGKNSANGRLLGARVYKVIDREGNVVPNEYIVLQDFIANGCGAGSANCDWNDNTFYFINIRPEAVPTAEAIEDYFAEIEETFELDILQYFDKGYPGNTLDIVATVEAADLPNWMNFDGTTGLLTGTPPVDTAGTFNVVFTGTDTNGLEAVTSLAVTINEPPVAIDDEGTTRVNVALILDQLLANDSEPNGNELNIINVDNEENGIAILNANQKTVEFTPDNDFEGIASFTYTIEDETGLTDTAIVTILVQENVAPTAVAFTESTTGTTPLVIPFDASRSSDDSDEALTYLWDFGDGSTSNLEKPSYAYTKSGNYTVTLTVTDSEGKSNTDNSLEITVEDSVAGEFALRINAGGPTSDYQGKTFIDDQNFTGGYSFVNENADLPELYQSERGAVPKVFDYNIPLANGTYEVTLHFAEVWWGAPGGREGGIGSRVFDVEIEGNTVLDDYDVIEDVGTLTEVTKTFTVVVIDGSLDMNFDAAGSDGANEPTLAGIEVLSQVPNEEPVAVADSDITSGPAPLTVVFDSSGSSDDKAITDYAWDFDDGTPESNEASPSHIFTAAGNYTVTLTVTDDEGESSTDSIDITVEEAVSNDFALRINAGGPAVDYQGETFIADQYFVDGKVFVNSNATVPVLYQSERSASPPVFGYNIPLANGTYEVSLYFAEIWWGATGGAEGGLGKRIFDVAIEGDTLLDNYDINADVGAQTAVVKTFTVTVTDGVLDMDFDATGSDGVNQPKLSAIEILGQAINQAPVALAGSDLTSGPAPLTIAFNSIGSSDDKGITAYAWNFGDGTPVSNEASPSHIFTAAGNYTVTLTVSDVEGESATDSIDITVEESVSNDFALRINAGGPSLDFEGETFIADQYFTGGKFFENASAEVESLYQTERSSDEKEFNYNIPLANGTYEVTLHFAEIYWGATGGG
ncbi:malectin domain-containing carbohydrate-binding protein, partial [Algibacter mikhailovii]|uniref:malectin domain-containing carbohydrate-binding protein n=1 Tax=Algibacter mikhailovii TaxID=425498 RepID=UPI0016733FD7